MPKRRCVTRRNAVAAATLVWRMNVDDARCKLKSV